VTRGRSGTLKEADEAVVAETSTEACFVYVLGSFHKGRYSSYVGWTNDVARRLDQHNAGTGARSTRGRVWTLLHTETFETRNEAMSREWHLKRDRAFRKKLMDAVRSRPAHCARG
jgi:putative endonuclease